METPRICEKYLSNRLCSAEYARQLTKLAERLGGLTADGVNAYLRSRKDSVAPVTLANERRQALTLWRWAWEEGLVDSPPRGVMRVRAPLQPVQAWTIAHCQELVKGAAAFSGKRLRNGADLGDFLRCWVLLGYETGARYGDIFSWTGDNIRGCAISWVTGKTGQICTRILSDQAVEAARSMLPKSPDGRILGWVASRRYSFRLMRRLLASSVKTGSGRWLRRSAATHIEMTDPGKAQWFLAHRSPGLAARHYLDQAQLAGATARPPSLCGPRS